MRVVPLDVIFRQLINMLHLKCHNATFQTVTPFVTVGYGFEITISVIDHIAYIQLKRFVRLLYFTMTA